MSDEQKRSLLNKNKQKIHVLCNCSPKSRLFVWSNVGRLWKGKRWNLVPSLHVLNDDGTALREYQIFRWWGLARGSTVCWRLPLPRVPVMLSASCSTETWTVLFVQSYHRLICLLCLPCEEGLRLSEITSQPQPSPTVIVSIKVFCSKRRKHN